MTNKTMEINDIKLHYYMENTGKPKILFIHGFSASSKSFEKLSELNRPYDLITLDLPGHGKSTTEQELSVQLFVDTVTKFIELFNLDNLIVVGHSLGGMTALHLGDLKQVKQIILYSPFNPFIHKHAKDYVTSLKRPEERPVLKDIFNLAKNSYAKYKTLGKNEILSIKNRNEHVLPLYEKNKGNFSIIAGSADQIVRLVTLEDTSKAFDAPLKVIKGAKHGAAKTHTEEFNKVLIDLINI